MSLPLAPGTLKYFTQQYLFEEEEKKYARVVTPVPTRDFDILLHKNINHQPKQRSQLEQHHYVKDYHDKHRISACHRPKPISRPPSTTVCLNIKHIHIHAYTKHLYKFACITFLTHMTFQVYSWSIHKHHSIYIYIYIYIYSK